MKAYILFFLSLICIKISAQKNPTELAQPIVAEGKLLYQSEMASWYGTDLFLEANKNADNIGGYFSYTNSNKSTCVFFSTSEKPKVIGTIQFDSTYNTNTAIVNLSEREFEPSEMELYLIRQKALLEIKSDTLFKTYSNTSLNLIPLIYGKEKKVYILTGPKNSGVVIFGNDYLITFDNENNVISKKQLHMTIIPVYYGNEKQTSDGKPFGSVHNHLPETGEFITATDICTLMLYEKFAKWEQHLVISEKYMNIWDCKRNSLVVIPKP
jgi:hypothetical protein